jgi:hypothetical protein
MTAWEETHLLATTCHFPKWKGDSWYHVCAKDADYVQWLLDNVLDPDDDEELRDALAWGIKNVPASF